MIRRAACDPVDRGGEGWQNTRHPCDPGGLGWTASQRSWSTKAPCPRRSGLTPARILRWVNFFSLVLFSLCREKSLSRKPAREGKAGGRWRKGR